MAAAVLLEGSLAITAVALIDDLLPSFQPFSERPVGFAIFEFSVVVVEGFVAPCSVVQFCLRPPMTAAVLLEVSDPCTAIYLLELSAIAAKVAAAVAQRSVPSFVLLELCSVPLV
jgi:hypothetical protein